MVLEDIFLWPFKIVFDGAMFIIAILLLGFWIWMLIDCAKRKFKNNIEKIIWIIAIVLGHWFGSLIYFIVIKLYNKKGLFKK